ncbi:MAG: sensor histidine kinase [Tissierellia bacterium]|nr:sensor histidine kinase [Tissierellia bacterium]
MDNRFMSVFRHIIFGLLIIGLAAFNKGSIDEYAIILLFLFVINNNLRFFTFRNKKAFVFISIILEIFLSSIIYEYYGGIVLFYFILSILDGVLFLGDRISFLVGLIIYLTAIYMIKGTSPEMLTLNLGVITILLLISYYIKREYHKKLAAEKLYYKLRDSEDKLKKANMDLETYAESIKELTAMRERNRISREIHDSVGHSLSTIIIQLGAIEKMAKKDGNAAAGMAENLREFAKAGLEEIRMAIRELKPVEMEKYEPIIAIENLTKQFSKHTGVDVKLGFSKDKQALTSHESTVVYRIVQEFLSNSIRHGKASKVNIFMNFNEDQLIITLRDNGIGTDELKKGMGLTNIWERVEELGGQAQYSTEKGKGFLLRVVLPLEREYVGEQYG